MNCLQNNCTCANPRGNLVYLTKVFYDAEENASPILTALTTTTAGFSQQLSVGGSVCNNIASNCSSGCGNTCHNTGCGCGGSNNCGCGCDICQKICCCCCGDAGGCSNLTVTAATTFDITNAYVITRSFNLTTPTLPDDLAITVDGTAITDVTESGGQYVGDVSGIMGEITKCPCTSPCMNSCPGNFVLVSATGPWSLAATIILEGTIYEGGNACQFRLCFNTADGTPISVTGDSSFALCGVEIPCQVAGVSPSLLFDFDACASILNPTLTGAADGTITLSGSLVVTPQVRLRVTRPSLFNIDAKEVCMPCDDLGQCNACDPVEAGCLGSAASDCCCGKPTINRVGQMLSDSAQGTNCGCGNTQNSGCGCNTGCNSGCSNSNDCGCSCNTGCECGNSNNCGCSTDCGCNAGCGCGNSNDCSCNTGCECNSGCGCNDNVCGTNAARSIGNIACQCCETNGYSF